MIGPLEQARAELLDELGSAIADPRVLNAIGCVPRELFVPEELRDRAYENSALPIAAGQTISQPLVVARMCELLELRPDDRVLDVGTGSGYHAAVLGQLGREVVGLERDPELIALAREALDAAGCPNVTVLQGDGSLGAPGHAPFDAINVAAAARRGPPRALEQQLADGGRLVIPVGRRSQRLYIGRRHASGITYEPAGRVRFVPLIEPRGG